MYNFHGDFGENCSLNIFHERADEGKKLVAKAVRDAQTTAAEMKTKYDAGRRSRAHFTRTIDFTDYATGYRSWLLKVSYNVTILLVS